jgi:alcohol dehydrogenase class IV
LYFSLCFSLVQLVSHSLRDGRKTTIRDTARVLPRLVLYDPLLCHSMEREMALTSAFNAVAHAVEALWDQEGMIW